MFIADLPAEAELSEELGLSQGVILPAHVKAYYNDIFGGGWIPQFYPRFKLPLFSYGQFDAQSISDVFSFMMEDGGWIQVHQNIFRNS